MESSTPIFTKELFTNISLYASKIKPQKLHLISSDAASALKSLIEKVKDHASHTIARLATLPSGTNVSSIDQLTAIEVRELLAEFKKIFLQIERGSSPFTIYKDRSYTFNCLRPLYQKYLPKQELSASTWKEQALRLEQEILHEVNDFSVEYRAHLHAIAKLTQSKDFKALPNLYVCFVWPSLDSQYESWIPLFIERLVNDLESCGMVVYLHHDPKNPVSEERIKSSDTVLVMGCPSLKEESRVGNLKVLTELQVVRAKMEAPPTSFTSCTVIPIILMGSVQNAFPPELTTLNVADFSDSKNNPGQRTSYLIHLKALMEEIYSVPRDRRARQEWETSWDSFFEKVPTLHKGLSELAIEQFVSGSNPSLQMKIEAPKGIIGRNFQPSFSLDAPQSFRALIIESLRKQYLARDNIENMLGKYLSIENYYTELVLIDYDEAREKDYKQKRPLDQKNENDLCWEELHSPSDRPVKLIDFEEDRERKENFHDKRLGGWEDIHSSKKSVRIDELYANEEENLHVEIVGRAGIGKSVLCQYIAHRSAKQEFFKDRFDVVIWLPFKQLKKSTVSPYQAILDCCFPASVKAHLPESALKQFIQENQDRILFLYDGFDEIAASIEPGTSFHSLIQELLQQKNWIITTRPYATYQLRATIRVDKYIENVGFADAGIVSFTQKFFADKPEYQHFIQQLKLNPSIYGSAHIPINLGLILSVWESRKGNVNFNNMTMTSLYSELSLTLFRRSLQKTGIDASEMYTQHFEKDAVYSRAIQFLEELAWEGLKEKSIIFSFKSEHFKAIYLKYSPDDREQRTQWVYTFLNLGFLMSSSEFSSLMDNEYYFVHLTFQEFFAARYITMLLTKSQSDASALIQRHKFDPRYQVVWWFVAGLLKDKVQELNFFFDLLNDPPDILGPFSTQLYIRCLEECQMSEHLVKKDLYITEITMWSQFLFDEEYGQLLRNDLVHTFKISSTLSRKIALPIVLKAFREGDEDTQRAAAKTLEYLAVANPDICIPALVDKLKDADIYVKRAVAKTMGAVGQADLTAVVPALIVAFHTKRDDSELIGRMVSSVEEGFLLYMRNHEGLMKDVVSHALGELGHANPQMIMEELDKFSLSAPSFYSEVNSILGDIGKIHPQLVLPRLERSVQDPEKAKSALSVIGRIGLLHPLAVIPILLHFLPTKDISMKQSLVKSLGKIGGADPKPVFAALKAIVANKKEDDEVRQEAVEAIGKVGKRDPRSAISFLISVAKDKDETVKYNAIRNLGRLGKADLTTVLSLLGSMLEDENLSIKRSVLSAIETLGKNDPCTAINLLRRLALSDQEEEDLRIETFKCIGKLSLHVIKEPQERIDRFERELSKEFIENQTWTQILIWEIGENAHLVRQGIGATAAIEALEFLGKVDPKPVLVEIIEILEEEQDEIVIVISLHILSKVGHIEPLHACIASLQVMTQNNDSWVISEAIKATAMLSQDDRLLNVFVPLLTALIQKETDIYMEAAEALGMLRKRGLNVDITILKQIEKTEAVIRGLASVAEVSPSDTMLDLLDALDHKDKIVVKAAAESLPKVDFSECPLSFTDLRKIREILNKDSRPRRQKPILRTTPLDRLIQAYGKREINHSNTLDTLLWKCFEENTPIRLGEQGFYYYQDSYTPLPDSELRAKAIKNRLFELFFPEKSASSQFEIGQMYEREGGSSSDAQAVIYFKQAANLAHPEALFKLANWHLLGRSLPQSLVSAKEYLDQASRLSNMEAKELLKIFTHIPALLKRCLLVPQRDVLYYLLLRHPLLKPMANSLTSLQELCPLFQNETPTLIACLQAQKENVPSDEKEAFLEHIDPLKPVTLFHAAKKLKAIWKENPHLAIHLIREYSLHPRAQMIFPLLVALTQNPLVLQFLAQDALRESKTACIVYCLEELQEIPKEELKQLTERVKKILSADGLQVWVGKELIDALCCSPKTAKAVGVERWAFPIRRESLVPLSASLVTHEPAKYVPLLLEDLKNPDKQVLACKVIAEIEFFNPTFPPLLLNLLKKGDKNQEREAMNALVALSKKHPEEMIAFAFTPPINENTKLTLQTDIRSLISLLYDPANRDQAIFLLSQKDLATVDVPLGAIGPDAKTLFRSTSLTQFPFIEHLNIQDLAKLLVIVLAQNVFLTKQEETLSYIDPLTFENHTINCSKKRYNEFKELYKLLISLPLSFFRWTQESQKEIWSFSTDGLSLTCTAKGKINSKRLSSLQKWLIDWLGKDDVKSEIKTNSVLIEVSKHLGKIKKLFMVFSFEETQSLETTSESLSSENSSASSSED